MRNVLILSCLVFRDVLYLEFLYLRVISSCADGKIRIFNFLTGTCLKVMRANSRGEPGVSFYIIENRWVGTVELESKPVRLHHCSSNVFHSTVPLVSVF